MTAKSAGECERHLLTLAEGITMAFRRIPACPEGFLMGSRGYDPNEEPMHRVLIPEPFWMAETPVTQAQFEIWKKLARIPHEYILKRSDNLPVENTTWQQANAYCDWLTQAYQRFLPEDALFASLPCEAHWEYACRGGTETEYHSGDGVAALENVGWYLKNSSFITHPIGTARGQNAANGLGLCDMHGNVREWCLDRWDKSAYARRWDKITDRETVWLNEEFGDKCDDPFLVVRGGSIWDSAAECRSAFRLMSGAGIRIEINGFRVCLVRSPFGRTGAAEPERTSSEGDSSC